MQKAAIALALDHARSKAGELTCKKPLASFPRPRSVEEQPARFVVARFVLARSQSSVRLYRVRNRDQ
jgi:hypothetical protein